MEWGDFYEDYLLFKKLSTYKDTAYQAAAVIGLDGRVWTQTTNFPQLTTEERYSIMHEFDEPGTLTIDGLYLDGIRYVVQAVIPGDVIRATDSKGPKSATIKKTRAALVIGIYYAPSLFNFCNAIVEKVGIDLIKRGYSELTLFFIGRHGNLKCNKGCLVCNWT